VKSGQLCIVKYNCWVWIGSNAMCPGSLQPGELIIFLNERKSENFYNIISRFGLVNISSACIEEC
jgi:hypothetical protein